MYDVCLVLEETWPVLVGGVSTWVQELVEGLPHLSFSVAHLGVGVSAPKGPIPYRPPSNVGQIRYVQLEDEFTLPDARVAGELPDAQVYHALTSGCSAVAAQAAADQRGAPMLLTEHGMAWREAAIGAVHYSPRTSDSQRQVAWSGILRQAAQRAYRRADVITSVNRETRDRQLADGAPTRSCRTIPNATRSAEPARADEPRRRQFTVGLVARVVPIKDIATFIRSAALVASEFPEATFVIIGPTDHDEAYSAACQRLTAALGLTGRLEFAGLGDTSAWLPRLDAIALTSVSEAMPLALLEAMSAGIPVVATDVGGCRELVRGARPAGLLTATRSPRQTADALLRIAHDRDFGRELGRNGRLAVQERYALDRFHASYREIYDALSRPTALKGA